MTLGPDYFAGVYAGSDDPWGFTDRWYEQRKYALTLAALTRQTYDDALELGCSIGVLTALLAPRCTRLTATDVSAEALAAARTRVPDHVRLVQGAVPDAWPDGGPYDLVVVSEVAYYLDEADGARLGERLLADLAEDGEVVAVHWRHDVADYPRSGDEVHAQLRGLGLERVAHYADRDLLLDVLARRPDTVAERTGLA